MKNIPFYLILILALCPEVLASIPLIIIRIVKEIRYKQSYYYTFTQTPYSKLKKDDGQYGEYLVWKELSAFDKNGAQFFFNVYIPKENEETTELDIVMLTKSCIIVFESKNYSGWIFGKQNQLYWTQTLPTGRRRSMKSKFYNPIMQNKSHIKHLKNVLGSDIPVVSVVVFSDKCTFKDVYSDCEDVYLVQRSMVASTVSAIMYKYRGEVLNDLQEYELVKTMHMYSHMSNAVKTKHVRDIKLNQIATDKQHHSSATTEAVIAETPAETENQQPTFAEQGTFADDICPLCGGKLVLRKAKRGEHSGNTFYGCSNYPKCRYIRNNTSQTTTV